MAWAATLSSSFFRGLVSTSISPPPSISTHKQNPYHPIQSRAIPSIKNPTFIERNCKFLVHFSRKTDNASETELECIGTGLDVECVANPNDSEKELDSGLKEIGGERNEGENLGNGLELLGDLWEWAVLISPFFFWGTAMVAMKEVLPKVGPFFVASFRLIPAGLLLIGYARYKGRPMPSGFNAWLSITVFALVDATCFQGFLAEGLQKTSAGLGSVIIDSQPLTVAILAALLFGESIGYVGAAGLVLGVIGLLLLEVPVIISNGDGSDFSLWGSGEWWMLLAAQSMAIGTVMVRWVSKYSDPVMATGWNYLFSHL